MFSHCVANCQNNYFLNHMLFDILSYYLCDPSTFEGGIQLEIFLTPPKYVSKYILLLLIYLQENSQLLADDSLFYGIRSSPHYLEQYRAAFAALRDRYQFGRLKRGRKTILQQWHRTCDGRWIED
jgi:hypothetical protein